MASLLHLPLIPHSFLMLVIKNIKLSMQDGGRVEATLIFFQDQTVSKTEI